jgi:hypothetical protein
MANEFIARNGLIAQSNSTINGTLLVSGSLTITGSLNTSGGGGITGSLSGTASFATSASYALSSSQAQSSSFALTASTTPQLYRRVNVTDSGVISSSTALTLVYSQLIPANTFAAGDIITISWRGQKTNFNAGNNQYFYINTSSTVSGATLLGTHGTSTNVRMVQIDRKLYIKNTTTNTEVYSPTSPVALYYTATSTAAFSNIAVNWTIDQYLIAANTLASALDTFKGSSFEIERTRTT